ncbi:MAG: VWA domain-containing protein [Bacteroidetes bacterium]|nr:VWA domain-containing protein [Bacteroidota bacterium]
MLKKFVVLIFSCTIIVFLSSCRDNPSDSELPEIPPDPYGSVPALVKNNLIPSGSFSTVSGERRKLNLSGVVINNYPVDLKGTNDAGQNIWIEIDSVNKGALVKKVSRGNPLPADVVFCLDVSGSMPSAVVDSLVNTISSFADILYNYGLDLQFGGIGYVGDIRGTKNLTGDVANFKNWVRSTKFEDPVTEVRFPRYGSSILSQNAVTAIKYADSAFSWRNGAQRLYIVMTDAPVSPSSQINWANEWVVANQKGKSSVHVVFIGDTLKYTNLWYPLNLSNQNPKDIASATGGSFTLFPETASGLEISKLPVKNILAASHSIEFLSKSGNKNVRVLLSVSPNYDGQSKYVINFP